MIWWHKLDILFPAHGKGSFNVTKLSFPFGDFYFYNDWLRGLFRMTECKWFFLRFLLLRVLPLQIIKTNTLDYSWVRGNNSVRHYLQSWLLSVNILNCFKIQYSSVSHKHEINSKIQGNFWKMESETSKLDCSTYFRVRDHQGCWARIWRT